MEVRTISRLAEVMSRHNLTELQIEEQGLTVMLKRHPDDVNAVWPPQSALNEEEEISSAAAGAAAAVPSVPFSVAEDEASTEEAPPATCNAPVDGADSLHP